MLELVGRYRIQEQIGEGAMADVYRAYDPHIDRPLVVKVLKEEFRQDREYSVRFLREARAAGALSHPGIVTIFDVGEVDGYPFIVMEYLDGAPLSEVMKAGSLTPAEVIAIGIQLSSALGYAHAQGVVHRDVKPSNIIVSPDRRSLKLLDFGIARVAEGELFEQESLKTQVGQVVGTPRYMSPEQALGREIDGRSDIFSLGVVLYELASGRRAFPAVNAASLHTQIAQAEPEPLSKLAPELPRGLQFIIGKAMSREPGQRFSDGYRMAEALRRELAVNRAVMAEQKERHHYIPLAIRLAALLTVITGVVLVAAVATAILTQRKAMRDVALASGTAISSFVANNAALRAVDNAALPPEQQDWLPTEVFVRSASADRAVRGITVVDAGGVVRAASQQQLTGQSYRAPLGEQPVQAPGGATVSAVGDGDAFRFVRPITYAGRSFGKVDVVVDATALRAASRASELALLLVSIVTLGAVAAAAYVSGRMLRSPMERLRAALVEIAHGNLDFRISHHRRDEFGELFDGVNMVAQNMDERLSAVEALLLDTPATPAERTETSTAPEEIELQQVAAAHRPLPDPADDAPEAPRERTWAHDEDEDSTLAGDLPDNRM
jgi:serine/threonine-protein kinase